MVNYWKSKVLPSIKKVFDKSGPKKALAAEACKLFDEAKETYGKECEDKKAELQPKITEIYEASPAEIKALIKEPKEPALKKHSAAVQKFLDELSKIDFPGAKPICEAASKVGPAYLPGPVVFVLEKVSTFVVVEEKKEEEPAAEEATSTATEEVKEKEKEKEIVAEAEPEKKEEAPKVEEAEKKEEAPAEPPKP